MKKILLISIIIIYSCEEPTKVDNSTLYRKKADSLITQILSFTKKDSTDFPIPLAYQNLCNCIYQISNESFVYRYESEMPRINIKKQIIEDLKFENQKELDSVIKISENYTFDFSNLKEYFHIIEDNSFDTITNYKYLEKTKKIISEKCPLGVLSISKPIFNKNFNLAIIDIQSGFSCLASPLSYYKLKNDKWIEVNKCNIAFK